MKTNILKAALFTPYSKGRWGLPIINWSNPGEGKTSITEELCASFGLTCITLSPGEMGEGAFGVIPVPDASGVIKYPPPEWTLQVKEGGVVFIDEMSSTPPALQPPLLGLLFSRRIGGATLGARCRVIGAANPPEVAAGGFELAPPVANRCGHIDWSAPTSDEHADYMLRGQTGTGEETEVTLDAKAEEARVMKAWPEAWAFSVGLETAFLRRAPHHKNKCPKPGDPKAGRAWPSDRSWENAARALASARVHGLTEAERDEYVSAFIGAAVASEFFQFVQEADLPDPAQILDGKEKFTHSAKRLDRTAAVLNACVALITPQTAAKRDARVEALWVLLADLMKDKSVIDLLVPPAYSLVKAGLHTKKGGTNVLATIQPLLKAAGIKPRDGGV
jgi:MoxR-like ATPase